MEDEEEEEDDDDGDGDEVEEAGGSAEEKDEHKSISAAMVDTLVTICIHSSAFLAELLNFPCRDAGSVTHSCI